MLRSIKSFIKSVAIKFVSSFSRTDFEVFKSLSGEKYVKLPNSRWPIFWRRYYYDLGSRFDVALETLISSLDEESENRVKKIVNCNMFLLPTKENRNWSYFKYDVAYYYKDASLEAVASQGLNEMRRRYRLPVDHFEESVFVFKSGLFFIKDQVDLHSYILDGVVIDAGAFMGDTLLMFSEYNPKKIICFEPDERNRNLLEQTVDLNNIGGKQFEVVNAGLGEKAGTLDFAHNNSGSSFLTEGINSTDITVCDVISLDDYVRDYSISNIRIIKMDIQGFEYFAVKGGIETIRNQRPILLISIYHTPKDFFEIKPLLEAELTDYIYLIRKCNPFHPTHETMLIAYPKDICNS